jgi:hypothetical protein
MTYLDMLSCVCYPGCKIVNQMWCSSKMVYPYIGLVSSENFLKCSFLGGVLGVMDQFCGLHAHPILRRLFSSYEDT